jgi:hypothetical protein
MRRLLTQACSELLLTEDFFATSFLDYCNLAIEILLLVANIDVDG